MPRKISAKKKAATFGAGPGHRLTGFFHFNRQDRAGTGWIQRRNHAKCGGRRWRRSGSWGTDHSAPKGDIVGNQSVRQNAAIGLPIPYRDPCVAVDTEGAVRHQIEDLRWTSERSSGEDAKVPGFEPGVLRSRPTP